MSYYLDHDGHGDLTLWKGDSTHPAPVAVRHDCDAETWSLLLRGAGLHECQPGTGQVCNVCLGIPSVPRIDPGEECWCHLGIKDVCDVCQYGPARPEPTDPTLAQARKMAESLASGMVRAGERLNESMKAFQEQNRPETAAHNARVSRRNANAARITHDEACEYPGEVDDSGTRCTECGAEATR